MQQNSEYLCFFVGRGFALVFGGSKQVRHGHNLKKGKNWKGGRKTGHKEKDGKGVKMFLILKLKRRKISGINLGNDSSRATVIL